MMGSRTLYLNKLQYKKPMGGSIKIHCKICGRFGTHRGRGLCFICWYKNKKSKTLNQFPITHGKGRLAWNKEKRKETNLSVRAISEKNKGKHYSPNTEFKKGVPLSEDHKIKIRKSMQGKNIGEKNPMFGKTHTKEIINKWKNSRKGYVCSEVTKKKLSNTRKKRIASGQIKLITPKNYFVSNLGHTVRSSWEERIGLLLKNKNINYYYEKPFLEIYPDGTQHFYYPDFTLSDKKYILEVKGYVRKYSKDQLKLKLFLEQHPDYKVIMIGNKKYLDNNFKQNIHYHYLFDIFTIEDFNIYLTEIYGVKNDSIA